MNWWQRLRRRDQLERELDAELRYHFERQVQDNLAAGMSEQEARRRARLDFGGEEQIKEICRDARGTRWIHDMGQDLRFAVRLLTKERWFTAAAVGALALGIGVTSMIATIINGYYFRGLPVPEPERVVYVGTHEFIGRARGVSYLDYRDWQQEARSFTAIAAFMRAPLTISEAGQSPESVGGAYVSAEAFRILGVTPVFGRGFLPSDDLHGATPTILLGYRLWTTRYSADTAVIGRSVSVNGVPATVVGVMPESFEFPFREQLWQPLAQMPGLGLRRRDERDLGVLGWLRDRVSREQARVELAAISVRLAIEYPETNDKIEPTVVPFGEQQVGRLRDAEPPLAGAAIAVFVLLIACANVATLLLARAAGRAREMAIRASVGATRWRIVRQLLVESLVLAVVAGGVGLWLGTFGVRFVSDAFGRNIPYWMRFPIDGRVLLVVCAVCVLSTFIFGLAPALSLSRTDVNGVMKESGRAGIAPRAGRRTQAFLVAQLALTVIALAGAGLMMRSFLALYAADSVVDASRVLTMQLRLPDSKYSTEEQRVEFYRQLDDRLKAIPGVPVASVASARPFVGASARQLSLRERRSAAGVPLPSVAVVAVGPRYFEALQLPFLQGRGFTEVDGSSGYEVAIVNERFAGSYYGGGNPLGHQIRLENENSDAASASWLTIVGVSPTVRQSIASAGRPVVYLPLQSYAGATAAIVVGDLPEPTRATTLIRHEVAALDPDVSLFDVRPLAELRDDSRLQPRLMGTMLTVFAGIALLLSLVGLYAATAYAVRQRTHEIGVRMALGAQSEDVVWLFVRRGLLPTGIGLTIGLAGAVAGGLLLRGLLIQTSPTDPLTLVVVAVLLVAVAVAACFLPARRAARVDPLATLRYE